jgi:hypothetical protein
MEKINQANLDLQLAMNRSFKAMEPYTNILESENGMLAMAMVSGAATANASGAFSDMDLETIVQKASSETFIPAEVFRIYAKSTNAIISCYKLGGGI